MLKFVQFRLLFAASGVMIYGEAVAAEVMALRCRAFCPDGGVIGFDAIDQRKRLHVEGPPGLVKKAEKIKMPTMKWRLPLK